jgi:hypothetical protein
MINTAMINAAMTGGAGRVTSLSPEEAHRYLVQMLPVKGAQVTSSSETTLSGAVRVDKKPSCLIACVLAIFLIIPAIIYLAVAGKSTSDPFAIEILSHPEGSSVIVSGRGAGLKAARSAVNSMPR